MNTASIDYTSIIYEAPPWWQTLGLGAFGGVLGGGVVAVLLLLLARQWIESSIDRAYDDAPTGKPLPDVTTDDPQVEHETLPQQEPKPRPYAHNGTKMHRARCHHADGLTPVADAWSDKGARSYAMGFDPPLEPAGCCKPFLAFELESSDA